jgi:hypothetical protein
MGGLFDQLQNQLQNREKEGGISALDLASLPPSLRRIMRTMLREVELTHPEIVDAMNSVPEADRLSESELDEALASLTQQGWLIKLGVDALVTYKVNLRRKAGSGLTSGIWSALDSRMKEKEESTGDEEAGQANQGGNQ